MKHRRAIIAAVLLLGIVLNAVLMTPDAARAFRLFDVDDSYTTALLHMNGTDASTTFTDESGKTWTRSGDAQIDTAQYKFGSACGLFDGTGDFISAPDHADWRLDDGGNSNLWTIDFWVRFNGDPTGVANELMGQYVDASNYWRINKSVNNEIRFRIRSAAANIVDLGQSWSPGANTWYHVAIVKQGVTGYRFYVDGTELGAATTDTDPMPDFAASMIVGGSTGASYFNGWLDEPRLSKGIARWTSGFTPPTSEYPDRTFQTQTAVALTATAANYQTQTAVALTATAANYQTQTAVALTATEANYQTQTAVALTATEANYQTQTAAALTAAAANYQTQTAIALTATAAYVQTLTAMPTSTYTATATVGTPGAIGTPAFDSTITYGDIARWNALACIAVIILLWGSVWAVRAFLIKVRRT